MLLARAKMGYVKLLTWKKTSNVLDFLPKQSKDLTSRFWRNTQPGWIRLKNLREFEVHLGWTRYLRFEAKDEKFSLRPSHLCYVYFISPLFGKKIDKTCRNKSIYSVGTRGCGLSKTLVPGSFVDTSVYWEIYYSLGSPAGVFMLHNRLNLVFSRRQSTSES